MKIETDDYITMAEARDILDASPRGFYRAVRRAGLEECSVELWGIRLIKKAKLNLIRENFYPFGSEQREEALKAWGCAGGTAKAANARARA